MTATRKQFGNTITVEHTAAEESFAIDPDDVGLTETVVIDRLAVRLDGTASAEVRSSGGDKIEKLYAGAFGVEGSGNASIRLPLSFGLTFETVDGGGFLIVEYHTET